MEKLTKAWVNRENYYESLNYVVITGFRSGLSILT